MNEQKPIEGRPKPNKLRMKLHEFNCPPGYVEAYLADEMDEYLDMLRAPKPEAPSDARELAEKIKDTVSKAIAKDDISEHDIDEAVALIEAHDAKIRAELKKVPMAMLKDCRRMTFNYDADSSDREDRLTLIAARYGYEVEGMNDLPFNLCKMQ